MPSVLLATAGYDHVVRLWEASNGRCHRKLQFPDSQVNCLAISPDKRYIAAAGNPHTRLYDTEGKDTALQSFDGHVNNVNAAGFQKDSRWMYTGSDDGTLKIWDLRAPGTAREFGTCQREYDNGGGINAAVLHPNQGELIAGDEHGNIRVFDLTQNMMSYEQASGVDSAVRSISIAADASLAATSHDNGTVILWKLPDNSQTVSHFEKWYSFQAHEEYVSKIGSVVTLLLPSARLSVGSPLFECCLGCDVRVWCVVWFGGGRP
jgi:G protein beta subunit-like protein